MDSPELFIAFGAVMLVVALLGVAVDWIGKPLKHRRFVAKAYRYPDERQPRRSQVRSTEWSDAPFVMPVVEAAPDRTPLRYPDPRGGELLDPVPSTDPDPLPVGVGVDPGPPTAMVPVVELGVEPQAPLVFEPDDVAGAEADATVEGDEEDGGEGEGVNGALPTRIITLEETDPDAADLEPLTPAATGDVASGEQTSTISTTAGGRTRGWRPGQYVFNLTPDGSEPSATTVRTRYWKNVADTGGAGIFGADNVARMAEGRPPRRMNHRTGKPESMSLPTSGYDAAAGQTPVPAWPVAEIDPFASSGS